MGSPSNTKDSNQMLSLLFCGSRAPLPYFLLFIISILYDCGDSAGMDTIYLFTVICKIKFCKERLILVFLSKHFEIQNSFRFTKTLKDNTVSSLIPLPCFPLYQCFMLLWLQLIDSVDTLALISVHIMFRLSYFCFISFLYPRIPLRTLHLI